MIEYTHEFYIEREVNGEDVETTLQVELSIEPFVRGKYYGPPENCFPDEGGFAEINGPIMVQKEDGKFEPWTGELMDSEIARVEETGYEAWVQNTTEANINEDDDYNVIDFDDGFRDDRAIALAGGGKVFY
jgi:hypothetical protein